MNRNANCRVPNPSHAFLSSVGLMGSDGVNLRRRSQRELISSFLQKRKSYSCSFNTMLLSSNFIILNPSARSISHSLFLKESKYALELSRSFTRPTLATQSPIGSSSILGGKVKHFKYHSASVNAVYSSPLHQNYSSKGFSHISSTSLLVGGIVISIANDIRQYKNTVCTTSCGWFGKDENNGKDDDDILEKIKKAADEYISPILDSTGLKV